MKIFLMFLSLTFILWGCGLWRDEEPQERGASPVSGAPELPRREEGQPLIKYLNTFSGKNWAFPAKIGTKVTTTLIGKVRIPTFYEVIRPYDGFYNVERTHCATHPDCPLLESFPRCWVVVRDFHHWKDQDLILPSDINSLGIKFEIGGRLYPLGKIVRHEQTIMATEFFISEEMLDTSLTNTEAYLVIQPMKSEMLDIQALHFVDKEQCPDTREKLITAQYRSTPWVDYLLSINIEGEE